MGEVLDPIACGLPHREPFVFVDGVTNVTAGRSATCVKVFPASTPFFAGHFPGNPLVPGVILCEGMAQTAGIAAGEAGKKRSFFLTAIRQMKFLRPIRPEEQILFRAEKAGEAAGLLQFQVSAEVSGVPAAEGIIVLSETSKEQ